MRSLLRPSLVLSRYSARFPRRWPKPTELTSYTGLSRSQPNCSENINRSHSLRWLLRPHVLVCHFTVALVPGCHASRFQILSKRRTHAVWIVGEISEDARELIQLQCIFGRSSIYISSRHEDEQWIYNGQPKLDGIWQLISRCDDLARPIGRTRWTGLARMCRAFIEWPGFCPVAPRVWRITLECIVHGNKVELVFDRCRFGETRLRSMRWREGSDLLLRQAIYFRHDYR